MAYLGEAAGKVLHMVNGKYYILLENGDYERIELCSNEETEAWFNSL
ncbi:hypothetical protein LCGC14_0316810 [marine sediment metagenome]|uniref:PH domain-containing protein n=1 Tax=marine sediment metagenome TaxID=412755 RepID=A0A0F9TR21_9ZZZZ